MSRNAQVERVRQEVADAIPGSIIIADELEAPIEVPHAFIVDDESKASWVVRKVVEARQYAQRVEE